MRIYSTAFPLLEFELKVGVLVDFSFQPVKQQMFIVFDVFCFQPLFLVKVTVIFKKPRKSDMSSL